jgi:hypothetical protein
MWSQGTSRCARVGFARLARGSDPRTEAAAEPVLLLPLSLQAGAGEHVVRLVDAADLAGVRISVCL